MKIILDRHDNPSSSEYPFIEVDADPNGIKFEIDTLDYYANAWGVMRLADVSALIAHLEKLMAATIAANVL